VYDSNRYTLWGMPRAWVEVTDLGVVRDDPKNSPPQNPLRRPRRLPMRWYLGRLSVGAKPTFTREILSSKLGVGVLENRHCARAPRWPLAGIRAR